MFTIKSINGQVHDTSFGGYPYKIVVQVEIPVTEFNKLCPVVGKSTNTMFGRKPASRDLGNLVVDVNDWLYKFNSNIPAHNPSIDSKGSNRVVKGIKTLEFVYFFKDHERATALGFKVRRYANGEAFPEYSQYVNLLNEMKGNK